MHPLILSVLALRVLITAQPPTITSVSAPTQKVRRFGCFEAAVDLRGAYTDPFDPVQIDLYAVFTGPGQQSVRVNGFYYQPCRRTLEASTEQIAAVGSPGWRIRFAPSITGKWSYRVYARDSGGTSSLPGGSFEVVAGEDPGMVRRSTANPDAFAFENGQPFFAVGENMGWSDRGGSFTYDRWLGELARAGGNWVRVWMETNNAPLETTRKQNGKGTGPGHYDLENAWKLDAILSAAQRNHIYVMLCLGTYSEFTTGGFFGEGAWPNNPYNAANGGPCGAPADFWTNATARAFYKRRLRYLAARYGAYSNLQAWEFWNETDAPAPWMAEMAAYLRHAADPYQHLITTTYGTPAVWRIPEIDFTQTHSYGAGNIADHAPIVASDAHASRAFDKPHLMAEFGIDWRTPDAKYDPEGEAVNWHNGIWASIAGGDAGTAMLWWWDNYIHMDRPSPGGAAVHARLLLQFASAARFARAVPWTSGAWKPLEVAPGRAVRATGAATDLVLHTSGQWGKDPVTDYAIEPYGVRGGATPGGYLYAPSKAEFRTIPTFHVQYRNAGQFEVRVGSVSTLSNIRVLVDGKLAAEQRFVAAPAPAGTTPDYQSISQNAQYGNYVAVFNRTLAVDLPPGTHTVQVENADGDWATVDYYRLTGYGDPRYLPMNLYAVGDGAHAVLWAQNAGHTWQSVYEHKPAAPLPPAVTRITGLKAGAYLVRWWDPWNGAWLGTQRARATGGNLPISLPALSTDVAALIAPASAAH